MRTTVSNRSVYRDPELGNLLTVPVVVVGQIDGQFHVHVAGCGDLHKRIYRGYDVENATLEVDSLHTLVDSEYGPACGSFYEETCTDEEISNGTAWLGYRSAFKIFPCVSLPDEPTYEKV